jgi:hypothetical protein
LEHPLNKRRQPYRLRGVRIHHGKPTIAEPGRHALYLNPIFHGSQVLKYDTPTITRAIPHLAARALGPCASLSPALKALDLDGVFNQTVTAPGFERYRQEASGADWGSRAPIALYIATHGTQGGLDIDLPKLNYPSRGVSNLARALERGAPLAADPNHRRPAPDVVTCWAERLAKTTGATWRASIRRREEEATAYLW